MSHHFTILCSSNHSKFSDDETKKKVLFCVSAVSLTHVNSNQTEVRDPLRRLLQGANLFFQTNIEHVIWAILSPIIFDFVLFSKKIIFSLGPVRDTVRVSERSLR